MDYMKKIIEQAAEKKGGKAALAEYLGISRTSIADVIAGKRGLPPIAQDKLEILMNLDGGSLRALSEIITETKPLSRAHWISKLKELDKKLDNIFQTEIKIPRYTKKIRKTEGDN